MVNTLIAIEVAILVAVIGYGYVMISSTLKNIRILGEKYRHTVFFQSDIQTAIMGMIMSTSRLGRACRDLGLATEECRLAFFRLGRSVRLSTRVRAIVK